MKAKIRIAIDALMAVLLICLMSYQVIGEAVHEWVGIGMTVLLIVHNGLHIKWYQALFKGKYNAYRIVTTVVDVLLLVSVLLTAFCGMSMSNHAVPFLYGMANMVFTRTAHLALSHWSFILMGLHIGLHLPAMTSKISLGKMAQIILSIVFTVVAGVGLWLFIRNGIFGYITFRAHFAFFDYAKAAPLVFLENLAIEFFFAFVGANVVRLIRSQDVKKKEKNEKEDPIIPVGYILVAIVIGTVLGLVLPADNITMIGWAVSPDDNSIFGY